MRTLLLFTCLALASAAASAQAPPPPAGPNAPPAPSPLSPPPTPPPTGGALKAPADPAQRSRQQVVPPAPKGSATPEAKEPEPEPEPAPRAGPFTPQTGMDRLLRPWNVSFDLSTVSLFVPLKPGVTLSYAFDPEYTIELGAMSGSLSAGWLSAELGRYTETSYSAVLRSYGTRASFHYLIGVSQENTRILIGNRYVDMATGAGSIDVAQTQSWALVLGLGQSWKLRNGVSFGIDYARIAYPLIVANTDSAFLSSNADGDKKGFIADTLNTAAKIPRLSFLQLNLGWSF